VVEASGDELLIQIDERRWRVRGIASATSFESLRVNVLVARERPRAGEVFHLDTLDLYSARSRGAFARAAGKELGLSEELVARPTAVIPSRPSARAWRCSRAGSPSAASAARPRSPNRCWAYQRALFHRRKDDGAPLAFSTQAQRLNAVRSFFEWLVRNNRILRDPAAALELPQRAKRLPRAVLSASEAERILALPDLATPLGLRDRAMLELLYATGVRHAELAGLAVFDLDIERRALMVREGKGRKDRMIPTGERAAVWCERYLAEARPELAPEPDNGLLFLTVTGLKIHIENLSRLIAAYVRDSDVGKPGSCHLFRHTMATLMLEGGADTRYVQQMLGHADISSTQIYTRVSLRKLEAVHAASHPGAANEPRGGASK
jgi:integrase/recombinase XerD